MGVREGILTTPRERMHKDISHNLKHSNSDMSENPSNENIKGVGLRTF